MQALIQHVQKSIGGEPLLIGTDQQRQVFGHGSAFNRFNTYPFKGCCKFRQLRVFVQGSAMGQAPGPGKDRGDGVGGGFLARLVLAVVAGDGAAGVFGFDDLAVEAHQRR